MNKKSLLLIFGLFLIISSMNVFGSLTDGIVNVWKFDNTSIFESIHNTTGSNNGGVIVTGIDGNALNYSGANGVYATSISTPSVANNQITTSFWVKSYNCIKESGIFEGGQNNTDQPKYDIRLKANSSFSLTSAPTDIGINRGICQYNTWTNLVMMADGNRRIIYQDGILKENTTDIATTPIYSLYRTFGNLYYDGNNYGFQGIIDEVYTWNRTLTTTEISLLSTNFYPFNTTNFSIFDNNYFDNTQITNFSALINGIIYNSNNHSIITNISKNSSFLYNITIFSNNYFNQTYYNYNVSIDLQALQYQSIINFSLIEFDNNVSLNNFSLNITGYGIACNTTGSSCLIYPNNGTYNYSLIDNTGQNFYTPINNSFSVNFLDNKTINSYVTEHFINVTVKNAQTNANITNFSIHLTDLTDNTDVRNFNTTNGFILIPVIHHTYNLTTYNTGFVDQSQTVVVNTSITANSIINATFFLYKQNSITFNIYNKTNLLLFNGTTTINMIGSTNYAQLITNNGTGYIELNPDTYQIIITTNTSGFTPLIYYVTLNGQHENITAYFEAILNTVDFITKDAYNQVNLQGVYVRFYQNINGTVANVGSCISDYQGQCIVYLNPIVEYQLIGTFNGYQDFSGKITPVLSTYNINMQPLGTFNTGQDYFTSINVINDLFYYNNGFVFTYNDSSNVVTRGCVNVYYNNALFNYTCSNTSSALLNVGITNISDAYYVAQGIVYINNQSWIMKTANYHYDKLPLLSLDTKFLFLFIDLLLTLLFGLLFFYNISVALIITPLPTLFLSLFSMVPISRGAGITLFLIGLTLAFVIRKRS